MKGAVRALAPCTRTHDVALFGKNRDRPLPRVLSATPADLARIGVEAFGGESPYPPGFRLTDYDEYALFALQTVNYPTSGTPEYAHLVDRFLAELTTAADEVPPWGVVGAFGVATNFTTSEDRSTASFRDLMDRALVALRDDGVAYASVPPFALDHWTESRGYDGAGPAGWPSSLDALALPTEGEETAVDDLGEGESRRMSCDGPSTDARTIFAERSPTGQIVAVIDGVDLSDGQRKRWELGVASDSYIGFLRALGERLVTPSWWAHDDLQPYFPCRTRSRDDMRAAARMAGN